MEAFVMMVERCPVSGGGSLRLRTTDGQPIAPLHLDFDESPAAVAKLHHQTVHVAKDGVFLGNLLIATRTGYRRIEFIESDLLCYAQGEYSRRVCR